MSIGKLCSRGVLTILRRDKVESAARLMRDRHIGDVVVVDPADTRKPVGVLTDRDIAINVVAQALPADQTLVENVMSTPVLTLREDDGLIAALDKMSAHGVVRRAPVVDAGGHLAGLISVDDLVPLLVRELAKVGALIRHGQAGEVRRTDASQQDQLAP